MEGNPDDKSTKYVDAKALIYRTEETIKELNKPPCDEERNRHMKRNGATFSTFKHQILLRLEPKKRKRKKKGKQNIWLLRLLPSSHELL